MREATEREARAIGTATWTAVIFARRSVGKWIGKRPTKNQLYKVATLLRDLECSIEKMLAEPPKNPCKSLDFQTAQFNHLMDKMDRNPTESTENGIKKT